MVKNKIALMMGLVGTAVCFAAAVFAYPISPGFSFKVQANFLWARSNNTYEKTYAYNYRTANYLMGFTYEY